MFNFFKRKNKPEPELKYEQSNIAELSFVVDMSGDTWVECKWDASFSDSAHMYFAELLDNVSSGNMLDSALEFVREETEREGRLIEYQAILTYLSQTHQERMSLMVADMMDNMTNTNTSTKDSVVVNPSDILNRGHPHE